MIEYLYTDRSTVNPVPLTEITNRLCCKHRWLNRRVSDQLYGSGNRSPVCFRHGKYVPIFSLLEGYEAGVFSSQSERGSFIAEICGNFGFQGTRIPDRPMHGAIRLMWEAFCKVRAGSVAVDGPLGPRNQVKSGAIPMAPTFGFALLPVSVGSSRKIALNKRWDGTVCIAFGKPIKVPPRLRTDPGAGRTFCRCDHNTGRGGPKHGPR